MQKCRRWIAAALLLCMVVSLLPPVSPARAAAGDGYHFRLDTDGIDVGAQYLIVSAKSGSGAALRMDPATPWQSAQTAVTVTDGTIAAFNGDSSCLWSFSSATNGTVANGGYYLNVGDYTHYTTTAATLQFANFGGGAYGIYIRGGSNDNLLYLYYGYDSSVSANRWHTLYNYGKVGTDPTAYQSQLYLYKLVEQDPTVSVTYNGNGHTSGQLPEGETGLKAGAVHTVRTPTELRREVGDDVYLFRCWNTKADGSGTEYAPGENLTVTENTTLYAQWYLQNRFAVTVHAYLDGAPTDKNVILGQDVTICISPDEGMTYQELTRTAQGTYTGYVTENGTYSVWLKLADGTYEEAHGHKIVIYNQNGTTELLNYSVSYDVNGGTWQEGQAPATKNYHANHRITAVAQIPTREGHTFLGWKDQNDKLIAPGGVVTEALTEKTVLTAAWEELIDVTVNITLNHKPENGGVNSADDMHQVTVQLLQETNGVNLPIQELALNESQLSWTYDKETGLTTYSYTFKNLPQGQYHAVAHKSHYRAMERTHSGEPSQDQTVTISMTYVPDYFDLSFRVKVEHTQQTKALMPQAVNVKIVAWNGEKWTIISQQAGEHGLPITVTLDENGEGSGYYPVWRYGSDVQDCYVYRVAVTSFVMPDGSIVPASGDFVTYTANGSGLYKATVGLEAENTGKVPAYPTPDMTNLMGAYYDSSAGNEQNGVPLVTVQITPFTVTFDPGEGTLNGEKTLVLTNQYAYPKLSDYVPVHSDGLHKFAGWLVNGAPAQNLSGSYLTENVTYVATYSANVTIRGEIEVDATYEQDAQTVWVPDTDRANKVLVVLQKNINGIYNDVDSQLVDITYASEHGTGSYSFSLLPQDNVTYRVLVLTHNYVTLYNNNGKDEDGEVHFTTEEYAVLMDENGNAQVDLHLLLSPESYSQWYQIDASQISESFRPDSILAQILYRDVGDVHSYKVISQHTVAPYGMQVTMDAEGKGSGFWSVWNWHTNGNLYEYQLELSKLYGQGIYADEGTALDTDAPFTVVYGPAAYYQQSTGGESGILQATLIPKEYEIVFDLNLGSGSTESVLGMEKFHVDSGTANDRYAYTHTWSYASNFAAYPYREGYAFDGWISDNDGVRVNPDGQIYVGAGVTETVTLTAKWTALTADSYTVRHLELNTDKVLYGAQSFTGVGGSVKAVDKVLELSGYNYAGALVGGTYYDKSANPELTISEDPAQNLMVIYYQSDDGYSNQANSNLELSKTAILEDNGTYTVRLESFTKASPIITQLEQDTPLDIVLVLDQSGSIIQSGYLDDLQAALQNFIALVAAHGRNHEVDHRIALVGYAGDYDEPPTSTDTSQYPIAGGNTTNWVNTGVFDSNGDFHPYPVTGFNYTEFTGNPVAGGIYYTYSEGEYLLLTHHDEYRHLITEEEARIAVLEGTTVYGYADGQFVELERNSSGLWLYGDKKLYSMPEFFTYHTDVWTHRKGLERRQIHAYGTGSNYSCTDGHGALYQRTETQAADPQLSVYKDALVPVSVGAYGSGGVNPGLTASASHMSSNGGTYVQYGISMANKIFAANPLDPSEGRVRIMVMFTDGLPGIGTFDETVANAAIAEAYTAKNTHGAHSYTIGLYHSNGVGELSDQAMFMNAVSSNYPGAQSMDDVRAGGYAVAPDGSALNSGGPYYVKSGTSYYELSYARRWVSSGWWGSWQYGWKYTVNSTDTYISNDSAPKVSGGQIGGYTIYKAKDLAYEPAENSGYYATTDSEEDLRSYFADIMTVITTKITQEIFLHQDTILRDIMGQGLELTDGTVITAYLQEGTYENGQIQWSEQLEQKAQLTLDGDTNTAVGENGIAIRAYNLDEENTTDPDKDDYHPHTVDISGYDYDDNYINASHPKGYKLVVTITRIEARDDVQWGRSTVTNNAKSGLWLPADSEGNRKLLMAFDQPSTIFVQRAYVLDYGKEFTLSGWYFDDTQGLDDANAVHVDCDISNGMNWFNETAPNTKNGIDSPYGNTLYGNVTVENGQVKYAPVTTNWGDYDQFYVFGDTWRKTVLAQDANTNGNLWNKVTVIPANNVYYEDSFITTESSQVNGISGFTFTGAWDIVNRDANTGSNVEIPEHQENAPYGDVHGWSDSLHDDEAFTDGSAHQTDTPGAAVEFTFTGTGVDVYTRTNKASGVVIATLYEQDGDGWKTKTGTIMDNLAMSGDYYSVPTINFHKLPYGTYKVVIRAMKGSDAATGVQRTTYWVDGIRVYNPMGSTQNYEGTVVKEAYDLEVNAVFTEVRDILLDNKTFTENGEGAVFIDWIREGQASGSDQTGTAQPSYEIGTFEAYGPKNEVYLSAGQAIVLRVDPTNNYFVGMKSLAGGELTVDISGIDRADPKQITLKHTTDLYYQVTPVDGYIVIRNAPESKGILSVTRLRTTNLTQPVDNGGVLPVTQQQVLSMMQTFDLLLAQPEETPEQPPVVTPVQPPQPAPEQGPSAGELLLQKMDQLALEIFGSVRSWLAR